MCRGDFEGGVPRFVGKFTNGALESAATPFWVSDDAIRAVILTGAGERAFSAGGDIYEFSASIQHGVEIAVRDFVKRGQAMTSRLETFPKPIIVAVNGLAYGGGCEITEAAHLAVLPAGGLCTPGNEQAA